MYLLLLLHDVPKLSFLNVFRFLLSFEITESMHTLENLYPGVVYAIELLASVGNGNSILLTNRTQPTST